MKLSPKRLRKLERTYAPKAAKSRLRLTTKRIRVLERERIRKGESFEKVFKKHVDSRKRASSARIAKRFGLTFDQAKKLRTLAVKEKEHFKESYQKYFFKAQKGKKDKGVLHSLMSYESLYNTVLKLQGFEEGEEVSESFVLSVKWGELSYIGDPSGMEFHDFKHKGDVEEFPDESPWWGHLEIVETWDKPGKSLFAVIHNSEEAANISFEANEAK